MEYADTRLHGRWYEYPGEFNSAVYLTVPWISLVFGQAVEENLAGMLPMILYHSGRPTHSNWHRQV